jgi:predicted amidohydrolase YtcJ
MHLQCNLYDTPFLDMAMNKLKEFALEHPEREWIIGNGWRNDWFETGCPPGPQLLDLAVPDRPCVLMCFDGHSSWANTKAMQSVELTADTPDPVKGKFVRNEKGTEKWTLV